MSFRPDRIVRGLVRSTFTVTTHDGATWEGVLIAADDMSLELRSAFMLAADGARTPADGSVIIPRLDVAFLQRR